MCRAHGCCISQPPNYLCAMDSSVPHPVIGDTGAGKQPTHVQIIDDGCIVKCDTDEISLNTYLTRDDKNPRRFI